MSVPRLKKRKQFLRVMQQGEVIKTRTMVIQVLKTDCAKTRNVTSQDEKALDLNPAVQVGFTATRKLGNAVVRNRARRRMRSLAQHIVSQTSLPSCEIVFIARSRLLESSFSDLKEQCLKAFHQLKLC